MTVFKEDQESKRVIFNIELGLALRLEKAKESAKELGKKLDVDNAVNKALEKFLAKAEKHMAELSATKQNLSSFRISTGPLPPDQITGYVQDPEPAGRERTTAAYEDAVTIRSQESVSKSGEDGATEVGNAPAPRTAGNNRKTPAPRAGRPGAGQNVSTNSKRGGQS